MADSTPDAASEAAEAAPSPMRTRITELFGIRYPIVQGGLAHLSFSGLAAAVSEAGGLGQIGMACFATPEEMREDIRRLKALTALPFGVNFPLGHTPVAPFVDVALEEGAHVISITAGNPEGVLRQIAASGATPLPKTMVLVAGVRAARKAQDLGADAVIAVGYEGGGHLGRDDVGTLVLPPKIVATVSIPVLASGGIMDGRGMAAGLALGAEGVELGTRFIATRECVAHQNYKDALVAATEADTVIIERTMGRPARVLRRGPLVERILAAEDDLARRGASREEAFETLYPFIRGEVNKVAAIEGRLDEGFIWAGEGVGLIHDIPTARELIERMVREAASATERLRGVFG